MRGFALAAIFAAGVSVVSAVSAVDLNPIGQWEVTTGESRYRISYCGDGNELCAKLTWLRDDARDEKNLALLNRFVVEHAKPGEDNTWVGTMQYDGDTYVATARQTATDEIELRSCSGMFCRSFNLKRI